MLFCNCNRTSTDLEKNYYASNMLMVATVAAAKISVTLLIISIKPLKWVAMVCYGLLGVTVAWAAASIIALGLQCSPTRWALGPGDGQVCLDQYAIQIGIRAADIVIDLVIIVMPIFMMRAVQVARKKQLVVMFLFGLRFV